jgi:hypothetical protein
MVEDKYPLSYHITFMRGRGLGLRLQYFHNIYLY